MAPPLLSDRSSPSQSDDSENEESSLSEDDYVPTVDKVIIKLS